mgnify:CR=1 FL=1
MLPPLVPRRWPGAIFCWSPFGWRHHQSVGCHSALSWLPLLTSLEWWWSDRLERGNGSPHLGSGLWVVAWSQSPPWSFLKWCLPLFLLSCYSGWWDGKSISVVFSLQFLSLRSRGLFLGVYSHILFMFNGSILQGSSSFPYVCAVTLLTWDPVH